MHDGDMDRQQEFVLRTIEERDVRFIRLWFTDVLGILKSVAVAPAELEGAFAEGIGFDGSAIEGLTRVYEADMIAKPDPSTFQVLPWRGEHHGSARMFCDIETPDGEPSLADPRYVLKRALEKANAQGFTFYTHPEIEFYLFEPPADPDLPLVPVDSAGYFDHVPRGTAHDFRRATITMLESMGISVEFSHHEAGPGQNEIDLRYADAPSSSAGATATDFKMPRTSVNHNRMNRTSRSSIVRRTNSCCLSMSPSCITRVTDVCHPAQIDDAVGFQPCPRCGSRSRRSTPVSVTSRATPRRSSNGARRPQGTAPPSSPSPR